MFVNVCEWFQDRCRDKVRKINLRWNSFQARNGGGVCGASCGLQKGIKWFARFIVSRGWWRTLAGNLFSVLPFRSQLVFVLTMDL
jgi:hypothetical protein